MATAKQSLPIITSSLPPQISSTFIFISPKTCRRMDFAMNPTPSPSAHRPNFTMSLSYPESVDSFTPITGERVEQPSHHPKETSLLAGQSTTCLGLGDGTTQQSFTTPATSIFPRRNFTQDIGIPAPKFGDIADYWKIYDTVADTFDKDMVRVHISNLDVLLIFVRPKILLCLDVPLANLCGASIRLVFSRLSTPPLSFSPYPISALLSTPRSFSFFLS